MRIIIRMEAWARSLRLANCADASYESLGIIEMCVSGSRPASFDFIVIYLHSMIAFLALTNLCRRTLMFSLLLIAIAVVVELPSELVRFGVKLVKTSSL